VDSKSDSFPVGLVRRRK